MMWKYLKIIFLNFLYFSEEQQFNDKLNEENTIYLEHEVFDLVTEGLFGEVWEEKDEKSIFFLLQFECEEDMDIFIKKVF